ncbi:MAG: TIGR00266 family protein [Fuerstiella sp.]|mgnify:CR=1 FL=1
MQYEILSRPAASVAKLRMDDGESLTCEVGAMIAMTTEFEVETTTKKRGSGGGGIGKALKRMFAGENLFLNHFTAIGDSQSLIIGPRMLGDILHFPLTGGSLIVQGSSWLASDTSIDIDATWQGLGKALFSGERMFWLKCSGQGDLFLSSYGAIYEVEVNGEHVVDTGHIVAFEDTLQFTIAKAGSSLIGSFLGGEGLVCRFSGQGRLFCQSHNPPSFGKALGPKLKAL